MKIKIPWTWKLRYRILRDRIEEFVAGNECDGVVRYNDDKPHRCPKCHAITDEWALCKIGVVTCCNCAARFSRWPRFAKLLPEYGVLCADHQPEVADA